MGHHVFHEAIRTAAPREVGNNGKHAGRNKQAVREKAEISLVRVCLDLLPDAIDVV
jgi:hypothetical protein